MNTKRIGQHRTEKGDSQYHAIVNAIKLKITYNGQEAGLYAAITNYCSNFSSKRKFFRELGTSLEMSPDTVQTVVYSKLQPRSV